MGAYRRNHWVHITGISRYYVCLINSEFISLYVDNFVNNTSHFQINDARQLPIIVPSRKQLEGFNEIFNQAVSLKISGGSMDDLRDIQKKLDDQVLSLYSIDL